MLARGKDQISFGGWIRKETRRAFPPRQSRSRSSWQWPHRRARHKRCVSDANAPRVACCRHAIQRAYPWARRNLRRCPRRAASGRSDQSSAASCLLSCEPVLQSRQSWRRFAHPVRQEVSDSRKVWTRDVPVKVLRFHIELKHVGEQHCKRARYIACGVGRKVSGRIKRSLPPRLRIFESHDVCLVPSDRIGSHLRSWSRPKQEANSGVRNVPA
jgi:hypothetical protein